MHISDFFKFRTLFDSHTHIAGVEYKLTTENLLQNCFDQKIDTLLNVSTSFSNSIEGVNLAKRFNQNVKTFIGIDPQEAIAENDLKEANITNFDQIKDFKIQLENLYINNKDYIIGIGETGIDNHWIKTLSIENQNKSLKIQETLYRMHLDLADKYKLPLTIHSRGAEAICLSILSEYKNTKGIFHSYTGDYLTAKAILDSGNGIGVNGIFTFKKSIEHRELFKKLIGKVSSDVTPEYFYKKGIFFETDSPFLAPEGKRGEQNNSENLGIIYKNFVDYLT